MYRYGIRVLSGSEYTVFWMLCYVESEEEGKLCPGGAFSSDSDQTVRHAMPIASARTTANTHL
jgi:hypothetical protein